MKTKLYLTVAICCGALFNAMAQMPGGASPAGTSAGFAKLFNDFGGFSARAEIQELDNTQHETAFVPMDFTLLDNKIRFGIELTQVRSQSVSEKEVAQVKQMGMSHIITILRPDLQLIHVIYPDQKCVCSIAMSKEDAETAMKPSKTQRTPIGNETIDGHACVKNKVVVSNDQGQMLDAITWEATDLKNFPIQIQTKDNGKVTVVRYKQIRLEKPAASQFEPPKEYAQFKDMMELMKSLMKKGAATPEANPQPATPVGK